METKSSKSIVFVTGAFVTHLGWKEWQSYFESQGYTTYAPAWPHKEGTAEELRRSHPNPALARLTLGEVVAHYEQFISRLPEKPILIGHSMGGLITQILLNKGLAAAAVAIHSVPPMGVIPYEFSFLKAGWKSLGLFTSLDETYMMSFKDWQYAFTNGMKPEDQRAAYEANAIPESKRVSRGALSSVAKIDFGKEHASLLFIAGGTDHIMPASVNRRNFNKYKGRTSVVDFKEFPGNNHFVVGLPNWKETATYVNNWLKQH